MTTKPQLSFEKGFVAKIATLKKQNNKPGAIKEVEPWGERGAAWLEDYWATPVEPSKADEANLEARAGAAPKVKAPPLAPKAEPEVLKRRKLVPEPEAKPEGEAEKDALQAAGLSKEALDAALKAQLKPEEKGDPEPSPNINKGDGLLEHHEEGHGQLDLAVGTELVPVEGDLGAKQHTMLIAMNTRHAVIGNVGGKCRVLEWMPSEIDPGTMVPVFQSKTDFINRYANRQFGWKRGEPLTLGEWWWQHPARADYRGIVFRPAAPAIISDRVSGNFINLYRGLGLEPKKGHWPLMRNHTEQILSGNDPKAADYNIRWIAWGVQHPGEPAEAALVLRGKKGAGKGKLFGLVRKFYGPHGLQIFHHAHLTGQFNAHLWTCCYLFADEAFWAGDKQGEGVLKGLITEPTLPVTKKGIDTIFAVNRVKLAISSNSEWVVPASHDERRYAVNDVLDRYARGIAPEEERKEYFGALDRELRDGGAEAMLYDLLQMDLGDWHPREIPVTRGLMRQKKESLRGNFQWLEPLLQSGELPSNYDDRPNQILSAALVEYVQTFRGMEYATNESISGFLYEEMGFVADRWPQGNKFRAPKGGPRGWAFPQLLDLRARWETKFGGQWDWHDPGITKWQPAPTFRNQPVRG
jgi:hypothetical protein